MTDIDTMSLDELRIAVAREVMGWQDVTTRCTADGTLTGVLVTDDGRRVIDDIPDYPRDIAAAWLVDRKIERIGLMREYLAVMCSQFDFGSITALDDHGRVVQMELFWYEAWKLIAASAEQRCRAALKAIRT